MKSIVVYFSRKGNNYVNGEIKNLKVGNTEVAAQMLGEITGAKLFKIEPLVKYSKDYSSCTQEAKQDLRRDARPELAAYPESMDEFDLIYVAFPNYWGTMPMAVFTFLEKYDFTGKTIMPLCTHEGSGMGHCEQDIRKLCPGVNMKAGLAIYGAEVNKAKSAIEQWIRA